LIARRFRALKQTAATLKSSVDEVPQKVRTLEEELAEARKEISALRAQQAMTTFNVQLATVQMVNKVVVLAVEVPNADADTLRALTDKFREKYPKNGVCVLASTMDGKSSLIAVVTEDLVKRGLKAGDLITAIGGRGGGRPNMAQGSLLDGVKVADALSKTMKAVGDKLK
jgi:alanyl-tRNA synthetase